MTRAWHIIPNIIIFSLVLQYVAVNLTPFTAACYYSLGILFTTYFLEGKGKQK